MKEIWKPIPEYEGYYEVSNTGKVKSLTRTIIDKNGVQYTYIGKEKTPSIANHGYYSVTLYKQHQTKTFLIHRLVALVFLPNPNNLPFVNHKDENKLNNNVENLEWCSQEYNNNYGTVNERKSQTLTQNSIIMCNKNTHEPIKEFFNVYKALEYLNKPRNGNGNIYKVLKNERQSAYGYWWKYTEKIVDK